MEITQQDGAGGPERCPWSPRLTCGVPSWGPWHLRAGNPEAIRTALMAAEGLGERAGGKGDGDGEDGTRSATATPRDDAG